MRCARFIHPVSSCKAGRSAWKRRRRAGKHAVGGALAPLWRDVASTRAAPLNAVDTAWRVREAVPATLPRDLATCRDAAAKLEAARADGLLADEYDNGGLDADDLADDGGEGDGLFAALARGKLPEAFRRLADLAHRKAARGPAPPSKVAFVLDALRVAALPPPPTKKRARDDDDDDDDAKAVDVFTKRRAAAAKAVKVEK